MLSGPLLDPPTDIEPQVPPPAPTRADDVRTVPIVLATRVPDLVRAGLDVLLRPYDGRVALLAPGDDGFAHVELFDPARVDDDAPARAPRIALTWDTGPHATARARTLGAVRVLPLSTSAADLLAVCEQVHRGDLAEVDRDDALLSPREVDVVAGICRGLSNADIADELCLSVNSVKTYIRTAYRKMGVTSRSQALLWGLDRGF